MTDPSLPPRSSRALTRRVRAAALALLAMLSAAPALAAIDEADLLPVDQAFVLDARATAPDRIAIHWKIADGYYLYRHRTSVQADPAFAARALQLPRGKAYTDEFFGKVETYRGALASTLPGRAGAGRVTLTVKYQGCADAGICYPPQTRTLTVAMPAAAASVAAARSDLALEATAAPAPPLVAFGNAGARAPANPLLGAAAPVAGMDAVPLRPEQAFGFEAIAGDGNTLLLRFTPARGYYLYRDKTALKLDPAAVGAGLALGKPRWPRGTAHRDEYFGATTVYFAQVDVPVPVYRRRVDAARVQLSASFQGCQTDGICYPPMTRTVDVALPAGRVAAAVAVAATPAAPGETVGGDAPGSAASAAADKAPSPQPSPASGRGSQSSANAERALAAQPEQAEDSRLADALSGANRWWALLSFFGFGLLLAFTPCVLPMIPILSGLIAGHGPGLGARRAFALSFVYVLANALVFTAAGVVAGLVGANLQVAFQTPWVIVAFAALFVALALSSFGLYELQLPAMLRNRLGSLSDRQRGGSWAGVAVMGALSALIVGPCVAPPLAAAVLYIGQTQDPVFGGAALFLLAMGMGAPLVAFGVAAGRGLPTSGPWMVAVQRVFGVVFLGLAVWMLSRVLPAPVALALWGALGLVAAAMVALAASKPMRDGRRALAWAAALVLGLAGTAQLVGALAGSRDPLQPLAGLRGGGEARELPFRRIKSLADLDRELAAARVAGQPLMLDFYADWCVACKEMEKYTFPDPAVHAALAGFVLLKVDVTANDAVDQALMQRLGIIGPPATLFYAGGVERRELRLFGYEKAGLFAQRATRAQTTPAVAAR
ncbi:protein-disulfide reductase DsbD [Lysobacter koreensis]|uniref:Thiol:disulfide interchange protein DsbD n=1 Tax=Lysobacter koreensis TaxID=266122 RepID=A0ABW2YUB2_9GAMM